MLRARVLRSEAGPLPPFARTKLLTTVRGTNNATSNRDGGGAAREYKLKAPNAHTKVVSLLITHQCMRHVKGHLVPAGGKLRVCNVMKSGLVTSTTVATT